jgi:hypothetical protein
VTYKAKACKWKMLVPLAFAAGACVPAWGAAGASPVPKLPGPGPQPSVRALAPAPTDGYWQFRAAPGETLRLTAMVGNAGTAPGTFTLGATGAGTGSTTGVGYTLASGPTASWVSGLPQSVSLPPNKGVVVHAILHVPATVQPNYQYVGGIEALGAATAHGKGRVEIAQRDAAVVAWVVTVGSPRVYKVAFGRPVVTGGPAPELVFPARNVGQLLWAPRVTFAVRGGACQGRGPHHGKAWLAGQELLSVTRQWGTTVPGTAWAYPVYMPAALAPGTYCAIEQTVPGSPQYETFAVTPKQHHQETSSPGAVHMPTVGTAQPRQPVWLVPTLAAGATVVVLSIGALGWQILAKRPKRP